MDQHLVDFFMKNSLLSLVFFGAIAAYLFVSLMDKMNQGFTKTPDEVTELINHEKALIVDLRDKAIFEKGHIVNAIQMELDHVSQNTRLKKHEKAPIVMVCADGLRSAKAARILKKEGFAQVFVLKGGLVTWQNAGLPLEK